MLQDHASSHTDKHTRTRTRTPITPGSIKSAAVEEEVEAGRESSLDSDAGKAALALVSAWVTEHHAFHDTSVQERSRFAYYQRAHNKGGGTCVTSNNGSIRRTASTMNSEGANRQQDIDCEHTDSWIKAHQKIFYGWIAQAMAAAKK